MKKSFYFKATILTPTHVGGPSEKHLNTAQNLVIDNGKVYAVTLDDLLNGNIGVRELEVLTSNLISDPASFAKSIRKYLKQLNLRRVWDWKYKLQSVPGNELRTLIRDGNGVIMLPGSSLKGGVAAAIANSLYNAVHYAPNGSTRTDKLIEAARDDNNQPINRQTVELMRHVNCSDIYFDESELYITKISNLKLDNSAQNNHQPVWKNAPGNAGDKNMNLMGFATVYETIKVGQLGTFRLDLGLSEKLFQEHPNRFHQHTNHLATNGNGDKSAIQWLIEAINKHTLDHLEREIAYYRTYDDTIASEYENIYNKINKSNPNTFALRIGAGQGYHSITGDWIFNNHVTSVNETSTLTYKTIKEEGIRGKKGGTGNRTKSRKLAIDQNNNGYSKQPMGFVLFELLDNHSEEDYASEILAKINPTVVQISSKGSQQLSTAIVQQATHTLSPLTVIDLKTTTKIKGGKEVIVELVHAHQLADKLNKVFKLLTTDPTQIILLRGRFGESSSTRFKVTINQDIKLPSKGNQPSSVSYVTPLD